MQDPIDVAKGAAIFESAPVARFPIIGQITEPGRSFHPPATDVTVQAIYDTESIALLVRWHDMGADRSGEERAVASSATGGGRVGARRSPGGRRESVRRRGGGWPQPAADPFAEAAPAVQASEFSDAVAIQVPSQLPAGARKPYFIFGDAQNPVDLWFFDLARPDPVQFTGRGSADVAVNDTGDLTGVANYDQGEWSVIFKRPLTASSGAPFAPGQFMPIAFSVWDGFSRERGNRRGLTVWNSVYLEPEVVPSAVGPMVEDGTAHSRARAGRDRLGAAAFRLSRSRDSRRCESIGSHASVSCCGLSGGSMYKSIYVPVDNSDHSNRAVACSVALGKAFSAKLVGCHVYAAKLHDYRFRQMEYTLPEEYIDEVELERQRKIHDSLITMGLKLISDSYLDGMSRLCGESGLAFEPRMMDGKHHTEILKDLAGSAARPGRHRRPGDRARPRQRHWLRLRTRRPPVPTAMSGWSSTSPSLARRSGTRSWSGSTAARSRSARS